MMLPLHESAVALAVLASGGFFLTGLLTGVWKYAAMARSADAQAPYYVDICHRASLMYSFAALLLAVFAAHSAWSPQTDFWATAFPLAYFAMAIGTYAVHGLLRDTDNQLQKPHRLGKGTMPGILIHSFMWALIVAEIGGFVVLFAGVIKTLS